MDQLRSIVHFFNCNKSYKSNAGVLNHVNNLLAKANLKIEEEFRQLLTSYRFVLLHILSVTIIYDFLVGTLAISFLEALCFTTNVSWHKFSEMNENWFFIYILFLVHETFFGLLASSNSFNQGWVTVFSFVAAEVVSLLDFSKPVEPDRLFDCLPHPLRPSSGSPGHQGEATGKNPSSTNHSEHNKSLETAVYTAPTLIPPRILPLLHDLAQQMSQAGHQQQLYKIYRWDFFIFF